MTENEFLIPIESDAAFGAPEKHAPTAWDWLTDQLWDRFEGATVAPGLYEGFYRDPQTGQRVSDRSRKYIVAIPEGRLDELRELLAEACVVFHQKCIYLSVGGEVEFVEPPPVDP